VVSDPYKRHCGPWVDCSSMYGDSGVGRIDLTIWSSQAELLGISLLTFEDGLHNRIPAEQEAAGSYLVAFWIVLHISRRRTDRATPVAGKDTRSRRSSDR
jgi:hypothetical protein